MDAEVSRKAPQIRGLPVRSLHLCGALSGSPQSGGNRLRHPGYRTPGHERFELERFLAAEHNRLPIVFVSAHDEPEVRDEAAHVGALAFLGKPFCDNALLDAISTALK